MLNFICEHVSDNESTTAFKNTGSVSCDANDPP